VAIFKNSRKIFLFYALVCALLVAVGFFFYFWKIWEIHAVLFIGSVFNGIYLLVLLNWGKNAQSKMAVNKASSMVIFTVVRSALQIASLFLCAACVYYLPSSVFKSEQDKLKYFFVLLDLIPYGLAMVLCILDSKEVK